LGWATFEDASTNGRRNFLRSRLRDAGRSDFEALIVAVGENREHRRDAYETLGWATFEDAIDKRQENFLRLRLRNAGRSWLSGF
jgi:hypothetical protein